MMKPSLVGYTTIANQLIWIKREKSRKVIYRLRKNKL